MFNARRACLAIAATNIAIGVVAFASLSAAKNKVLTETGAGFVVAFFVASVWITVIGIAQLIATLTHDSKGAFRVTLVLHVPLVVLGFAILVASAAIYPQPGIIVAAVLVWIYGLVDMVIFAKPYKEIE